MAERKELPQRRAGCTIEGKINGTSIYLRTGEYEDGRLGEIFVDMFKEGAGYRGLLNCFAVAISLGLQHGVPVDTFIKHFKGVRFEPSGNTSNPDVPHCESIVDYIVKLLEMDYGTKPTD